MNQHNTNTIQLFFPSFRTKNAHRKPFKYLNIRKIFELKLTDIETNEVKRKMCQTESQNTQLNQKTKKLKCIRTLNVRFHLWVVLITNIHTYRRTNRERERERGRHGTDRSSISSNNACFCQYFAFNCNKSTHAQKTKQNKKRNKGFLAFNCH